MCKFEHTLTWHIQPNPAGDPSTAPNTVSSTHKFKGKQRPFCNKEPDFETNHKGQTMPSNLTFSLPIPIRISSVSRRIKRVKTTTKESSPKGSNSSQIYANQKKLILEMNLSKPSMRRRTFMKCSVQFKRLTECPTKTLFTPRTQLWRPINRAQ